MQFCVVSSMIIYWKKHSENVAVVLGVLGMISQGTVISGNFFKQGWVRSRCPFVYRVCRLCLRNAFVTLPVLTWCFRYLILKPCWNTSSAYPACRVWSAMEGSRFPQQSLRKEEFFTFTLIFWYRFEGGVCTSAPPKLVNWNGPLSELNVHYPNYQ
jgi:hypothetical protein